MAAPDLLTCDLSGSAPFVVRGALRSIGSRDRAALAALYLASYPAAVGAADLDEAFAEIDRTFAGEYGVLLEGASLVALRDGLPAGAVLVTERSIWDPDLAGPFVIDLFVEPGIRGRGLGRALMLGAMNGCRKAGQTELSLRVGEGTSAAAHRLYASLGFRPAG